MRPPDREPPPRRGVAVRRVLAGLLVALLAALTPVLSATPAGAARAPGRAISAPATTATTHSTSTTGQQSRRGLRAVGHQSPGTAGRPRSPRRQARCGRPTATAAALSSMPTRPGDQLHRRDGATVVVPRHHRLLEPASASAAATIPRPPVARLPTPAAVDDPVIPASGRSGATAGGFACPHRECARLSRSASSAPACSSP